MKGIGVNSKGLDVFGDGNSCELPSPIF